MEHSILQITLELTEKIVEKALNGELSDIDALASDVLNDCRESSCRIIETIVCEMNLQLRNSVAFRKEAGLVMKEKERPRTILTELGELNLRRDYYRNKNTGEYEATLDHMLGIEPYTRVGAAVSAKLVESAAERSYFQSSQVVTNGKVSRQAVHDLVAKAPLFEIDPPAEKRSVKQLHLYADEDHVHMQKPCKQRGKQSRMVPMVTVSEGMCEVSKGRNKTVNAVHFVEADGSSQDLWNTVDGYLQQAYDMQDVSVNIYGDGGAWIRRGIDVIPNSRFVVDGYHFERDLRAIARLNPKVQLTLRVRTAALYDRKENARKAFDDLMEGLSGDDLTRAKAFAKYALSNWDAVVLRYSGETTGSCTEGQVSHVLSSRFSRSPMGWSISNLNVLTKVRAFILSGGKVRADDFKAHGPRRQIYREYAENLLKYNLGGSFDWSIFSGEASNLTSGTSFRLSKEGNWNRLIC